MRWKKKNDTNMFREVVFGEAWEMKQFIINGKNSNRVRSQENSWLNRKCRLGETGV